MTKAKKPDYIGNREPFDPFTYEEIAELEEGKEKHFQKLRQIQDEIFENYLQQAWKYIKETIISNKN